jgi:hypothetical protein
MAIGAPVVRTSHPGLAGPRPAPVLPIERTETIQTAGGTITLTTSGPEPVSAPAAPMEDLADGARAPDFGDFERRYVEEPRDEEWASAQEQRIATAMVGQELGANAPVVHCQQTLCRLEIATHDADAFERLLNAPDLQAETGLSPRSPHALRSGQVAIYFHGVGRRGALGIPE